MTTQTLLFISSSIVNIAGVAIHLPLTVNWIVWKWMNYYCYTAIMFGLLCVFKASALSIHAWKAYWLPYWAKGRFFPLITWLTTWHVRYYKSWLDIHGFLAREWRQSGRGHRGHVHFGCEHDHSISLSFWPRFGAFQWSDCIRLCVYLAPNSLIVDHASEVTGMMIIKHHHYIIPSSWWWWWIWSVYYILWWH